MPGVSREEFKIKRFPKESADRVQLNDFWIFPSFFVKKQNLAVPFIQSAIEADWWVDDIIVAS